MYLAYSTPDVSKISMSFSAMILFKNIRCHLELRIFENVILASSKQVVKVQRAVHAYKCDGSELCQLR
jgi:hypothetical protein